MALETEIASVGPRGQRIGAHRSEHGLPLGHVGEDWAGKIAGLLLAGHAVTRHITALEKWIIYIYSEYSDLL